MEDHNVPAVKEEPTEEVVVIQFVAETAVKQYIVIVDKSLTVKDIVDGLNSHKYHTTISHDNGNETVTTITAWEGTIKAPTFRVVAKIVKQEPGNSFNNYTDFEAI